MWKHAIHAGVLWLALSAHSSVADAKELLAPTGTLPATLLGGNPVQGRIDAASGAVTGPVADLVQELSRRLGVPFRIALRRTFAA
jgi:hypothetical protein